MYTCDKSHYYLWIEEFTIYDTGIGVKVLYFLLHVQFFLSIYVHKYTQQLDCCGIHTYRTQYHYFGTHLDLISNIGLLILFVFDHPVLLQKSTGR